MSIDDRDGRQQRDHPEEIEKATEESVQDAVPDGPLFGEDKIGQD